MGCLVSNLEEKSKHTKSKDDTSFSVVLGKKEREPKLRALESLNKKCLLADASCLQAWTSGFFMNKSSSNT